MSETKRVRFVRRAGDPRSGMIIQPGTVTEVPSVWAERYIAQGIAEAVETESKPQGKPQGKPKAKTK